MKIDKSELKQIIKEELTSILKEADVTQVYEVVADLTYTREGDRDQADILTEIRAIEGVTIVTILIPAQGGRQGESETVRVKIKFRPLIGGVSVGLQTYIPALKRTVARVGGVRSFDISLASKY